MYDDKRNNRILLMNGKSIMDIDRVCLKLIRHEPIDGVCVLATDDVVKYDKKYLTCLAITEDDVDEDIIPPVHHHTDDDLKKLIEIIDKSDRISYNDVNVGRIETELDYFIRSENILFLLKAYDMIQRFKQDNVVWGVGRGSACASYILYLLHVHDVNPVDYDIPFHEMSKEK